MRSPTLFIVRLSLVAGFAAAAFVATLGTYTLAKVAVLSARDGARFEAHMRHYTDNFIMTPDGNVRLVRLLHPVLQVIGVVTAAWVIAVGLFVAQKRFAR